MAALYWIDSRYWWNDSLQLRSSRANRLTSITEFVFTLVYIYFPWIFLKTQVFFLAPSLVFWIVLNFQVWIILKLLFEIIFSFDSMLKVQTNTPLQSSGLLKFYDSLYFFKTNLCFNPVQDSRESSLSVFPL